MTCIVGVKHKGKVYIGGDSAGVAVGRLSLQIRADKKVFKNGEFIMGFTSSFRMGQLLAYSLKPPKRHADTDIYAYMVTDFVDAVRECLKNGGYAEKHNEGERGGEFLVGYAGRLFTIQGDYQVSENLVEYAACGCGDLIALGALAVTDHYGPEERVMAALRTAESLSAGVRGPFNIECL